jgi:hypothetical protein
VTGLGTDAGVGLRAGEGGHDALIARRRGDQLADRGRVVEDEAEPGAKRGQVEGLRAA